MAEGGDRDHRLNRVAFCLGMLVAGGELSEGRVVAHRRNGGAVGMANGLCSYPPTYPVTS